MEIRYGFDIGGTKIELRAVDPAGHELWAPLRRDAPDPALDAAARYRGLLTALQDLLAAGRARSPAATSERIGFGIPGTPDPVTGRIKNANSTYLIGQDFKGDVEEALGTAVRVANDANCMLLSEARGGAAEGARTAFGAILGTGIGGAVGIGGRVLSGPNGIAGEWGHNPMPTGSRMTGDRPCYCGRRDCIETWLSGPGLARTFAARTGIETTAAAIFARAQDGEAPAQALVDDWLEDLARALGTAVNLLDPDVLVLAGGLSQAPNLKAELTRRLPPYAFNRAGAAFRLCIETARWGDASGARGACFLWDG